MALALKTDPPNRDGTPEGALVDGGIGLRHVGWLVECDRVTAYTFEELDPLPDALLCAHCQEMIPLAPDSWTRAELERLLSVHRSGPGDE